MSWREGRRVHGAVAGWRWRWGRRVSSVAPASDRYGILQRGRCLPSAVARTFHPDIWSSGLENRIMFPASFWAAASRPMKAAGRMRTVSKIGTRQMAGEGVRARRTRSAQRSKLAANLATSRCQDVHKAYTVSTYAEYRLPLGQSLINQGHDGEVLGMRMSKWRRGTTT